MIPLCSKLGGVPQDGDAAAQPLDAQGGLAAHSGIEESVRRITEKLLSHLSVRPAGWRMGVWKVQQTKTV